MIALFVYGTLQHGPLLERLLGRVPQSVPARVFRHRAAPLSGRVYPGLVVDPVGVAWGRLLAVTDEEAETLDRFEGAEYTRTPMTATMQSGAEMACEAWLLTGASRASAGPGDWDLEQFLTTGVDIFLDASTSGEVHPGAG